MIGVELARCPRYRLGETGNERLLIGGKIDGFRDPRCFHHLRPEVDFRFIFVYSERSSLLLIGDGWDS